MSLGLTIVTHTCKEMDRDITRCVESVEKALVPGCTHKIIEISNNYTDFLNARYNALQLDDIVVFVDDDDYISENSLKCCLDALSGTDAGIAFTNETMVHQDGRHVTNRIDLKYSSLSISPQAVHHMTAYRQGSVTQRTLDLSLKYNCTIEWISRADAAYNMGAIYIPIVGYYWVQHKKQTCRSVEHVNFHKTGMSLVRSELEKWNTRTGLIPTWK